MLVNYVMLGSESDFGTYSSHISLIKMDTVYIKYMYLKVAGKYSQPFSSGQMSTGARSNDHFERKNITLGLI